MICDWVIDTLITERARPTGLPTLAEVVCHLGHRAFETHYRPIARTFEPMPDLDGTRPVIFHGTHEGLRAFQKMARGLSPVGYCLYGTLSYAGYASHIGEDLLNADFIMLPVGEVRRRMGRDPEAFLAPFGGSAFIRPNAVTKTFAARVLTPANGELEMRTLSAVEIIDDDVIAVLASEKPISFEFRFVIARGKVVAQSQYQYDGRLDIRTDVMPEARALADRIAAQEWQADTVYVCDVGLAGPDLVPKVIELNSFSCAGLYACDTVAIVDAVSRAAAAEFTGDPEGDCA